MKANNFLIEIFKRLRKANGLFIALLMLSCMAKALPPGFTATEIIVGVNPTAFVQGPDGRVFMANKDGRVFTFRNDSIQAEPFLSIEVDDFNERGLEGIALHPNYEQNQWIYTYYTIPGANMNRLSRFTANGDFAIPGSEVILMEFEVMAGTIHNGGAMVFGNDGKLYITTGDGADALKAQSLTSLQGKIIRLNDDGTIPDDNPLMEITSGIYKSIYATGLRNPFSMDIAKDGTIFVNDVGQSTYEEVNRLAAGANYGWPMIEGYLTVETPPNSYLDPIHVYDHDQGCAIVGAEFYDGDNLIFPEIYHDNFFFSDYCNGTIRLIDANTGEDILVFQEGINRPLDILKLEDGSLYYMEREGQGGGSPEDNTLTDNGSLWHVIYTGNGVPVIAEEVDDLLVSAGEPANFTVTATGSPVLEYRWEENGITLSGENDPTLTIPITSLDDDGNTYRCIVSNSEGLDTSRAAILHVTNNRRPSPTISNPLNGAPYQAGTTISFSGSANDPEDGLLDSTSLTWWIEFHHDEHEHPGLDPVGNISSGYFEIPEFGETSTNVFYRINLRATDSGGLTGETFVDLLPETANMTFDTEPSGLPINLDGRIVETPVNIESVVGIQRNFEANESLLFPEGFYQFETWTDDVQETLRSISTPPGDTSISAIYKFHPSGMGNGLTGKYYNNQMEAVEGIPDLIRVDPDINFNWGGSSPYDAYIDVDHFAVRWEGWLQPYISTDMDLHIVADDGVRLYLDEELIIDEYLSQPAASYTRTVSLNADSLHRIQLDYFEDYGNALVRLEWTLPGLKRLPIPTSQLYDANRSTLPGTNNTSSLKVWPNPASGQVYLILPDGKTASGKARIYTVTGILVASVDMSDQNGMWIDTKAFQKGAYVAVVESNGQLFQARVIIH